MNCAPKEWVRGQWAKLLRSRDRARRSGDGFSQRRPRASAQSRLLVLRPLRLPEGDRQLLGQVDRRRQPMACGWLTDRFGMCWQIVRHNISELISHPNAMEAMMGMIKMDLHALEAAAKE